MHPDGHSVADRDASEVRFAGNPGIAGRSAAHPNLPGRKSELDAKGHHACTCQKGSQQLVRHMAIVRELGKQLRRRGLFVREEQWVDERTKREFTRTKDGLKVEFKEARLDLVVRDGSRLWWLDFTCFHPFQGVNRGGTARGTGR